MKLIRPISALLLFQIGVCNSLTIEEFVNLDPSIQKGYMIGVLDIESTHYKPESNFKKCAFAWLKSRSHESIKESYDKKLEWMNTALYVTLEVKKVCIYDDDKIES